jgi:hypothetical protein
MERRQVNKLNKINFMFEEMHLTEKDEKQKADLIA